MVNPYSDEALYRQVAAEIRQQIETGELRHLDRLPPELELAERYGVGRDTVRNAIALLRDEGAVFTIPHRGTYVGPRPS
jgi:DNA-binding GntR family transcriptional regulator